MLRKYNGIDRKSFPLFLKECELRFNYGTPKQQLKTLRNGCELATFWANLIQPQVFYMSNTIAKKRYAQTATRINQAKLASGEYRQFSVKGKDIEVIEAAINKIGGSRVQALKAICEKWLAQN